MSTARFKRGNGQAGSLSNGYAVTAQQLLQAAKVDDIDAMMGFERYVPPQYNGRVDPDRLDQVPGRTGWLVNMHPTLISEEIASGGGSDYNPSAAGIAGVDFYFLDEEGGSFKSSITYDPYFFVTVTDDARLNDVEEFLKKYLETCLKDISTLKKEDLKLDNHLLGLQKSLIKLSFVNSNQLFEARKLLRPILAENESNKQQRNVFKHSNISNGNGMLSSNVNRFASSSVQDKKDAKQYIEDIREYDVPYHVRVSIDKDIRVGKWYKVTHEGFFVWPDKVAFADPVVLAFDIETTKAPLKFPEASVDQVMMISYMIDGDGFLITNREIISEDIEDFEYTPKPELQGHFTIFNEVDELAVLQRFFEHIKDVRPTVISTFNGDFFDWPFIEKRASVRGLDMFEEIGFAPDSEGEYKSSYCVHMDCFRWVKRDSYLPQGSQGLKAVTQAKLGYNPIELDPELMTPYAYERPQQLSEYSVSDAVATYYLYMKYVHPFIFSLCTIIPLNPDEVLRKGTGTLCEMLLMVQAYQGNILLPNKHTDPLERFYDGHLLESETYVGGHVESLEAGVFRSDLATEFKIDTSAIDELIEDLPHALKFAVEVENKAKMEDVTNFEEIKEQIKEQLLELKENNKRHEKPLIYHVDVASMYPNIMTTNRLQPDSIKTEKDCASCDFNRPGKSCARRLKWAWRGEFYPAKSDEYNMIKRALQNETFPNKNKFSKKPYLTFDELSYSEQVAHIKKRLTEYSKKVYHRIKVSEIVEREAIVCQRENPFYVNTVKSFRDRRYEFKGLAKKWKGKMSSIDRNDKHGKDEANKMVVLYDSLQLAHKVILNSFYGYVMRKGSRWYSMEMAGITCLTGATIIQMARALVERVGRPLELDTDGIWCILPKSFPENFFLKLENGKKLFVSYPCSMLNYRVHQKFTNHQYQELVDPVKHKYETHSENTIFFEVDGPYKAMILPTSKEEGKGIKKRYAVFNEDGSLAELKGFELKRRGELQLIKNFQSDIFKVFLDGKTLEECYASVAAVSNRWLDILDNKGSMLEDEDLVSLICENRSMSKSLKEYEGQKSTSITTAKRLGEFLGEDMVKDKGLQCKYIISSKPHGAPVTERAIPVAIFSSDINVKRSFLRRWTMDHSLDNFDIRTILDWGYYRERLASVIQKIITIPAALQNVPNPVPRVEHPDWLKRRIAVKEDKFKQSKLERFLSKSSQEPQNRRIKDIEDLFHEDDDIKRIKLAKVTSRNKNKRNRDVQKNDEESLVLPATIPSMEEDYVSWLSYQKIKWKIQRRDRIRRTQLFGKSGETNSRSVLGSMIRKQAEMFANGSWEVLQYRDNYEAGAVDAYVIINGKVQVLKIYVPRTLYINFKTDSVPLKKIKNCEVERSNAILPNDARINNDSASPLFKLTLSEQVYLDELEDSGSVLNDESVLGIYESHISPAQKALMDLGTTISFKSKKVGSLGKSLQDGFHLKDLTSVGNDRYLSHFDLNVCYLLHIDTNIDYEFFVIFRSWENKLSIFVKKPSNNAQELLESTIIGIFKEQYHKRKDRITKFNKYINLSDNVDMNSNHYTDKKKLFKAINQEFAMIKEQKGQQVLLLMQSPFPSLIKKNIRYSTQIPIIELSMNILALPQLNWQNVMINKLCSYIISTSYWVSHLVSLSQHSNVPICNINLEKMDFVIDVIYARRLKLDNIILWWNEQSPLPDHGGMENDFDQNTSWIMNDLDFPNINVPDVYDNVVLEVSIENLVVNTILCSTLINEAEGSDLVDMNTVDVLDKPVGNNQGIVQDSFSHDALAVLKSLLKEWWDKALEKNITADLLVNSLVSWVYSTDSKLFDGSLRYHIHNLTKKSLFQLMNEFNELGSFIVSADRNRLLIKTNKISPETCYAYSHYMIKSIRSNPMFTYLDLNIERYWDLLIWMDKYNFSGLSCSQIEEREKQDYTAYSNWQIKYYLPRIYQSEFEDWAMIILDSMVKTKRAFLESSYGTQRATQIVTGLTPQSDTEDISPLSSFSKEIGKPLLQRVNKLFRNQREFILDPGFSEDYAFPILPGSHIKMDDPLLEFIKSLFQILLLSKSTTLEVRQLRKEVLKFLEIREFAKEAEFQNPSDSLVINGILCEYCSYVSDLDLCRDGLDGKFQCPRCDKSINDSLLQEHMIQNLAIEYQTYITQDLRCEKCHTVKRDLMSTNCNCSGNWICTTKPEKLSNIVKIYKQVAEFYDYSLVKNALESLY